MNEKIHNDASAPAFTSTSAPDSVSASIPANEPPQSLAQRGKNRTRQPKNQEFRAFIGEDWGPRPDGPQRMEVADFTAARRRRLGAHFVGQRIVIPAGDLQARSNDTDYRFRAHSAFSYFTGLGTEHEPGAVLVLHPIRETANGADGSAADTAATHTGAASPTHEAVLYFHPRASRSSEEFYADPRHGEFWVGARPSAADMATATGIQVKHIDSLRDDLAKDLGSGAEAVQLRVMPQSDAATEALVAQLRSQNGLTATQEAQCEQADAELAEAASEMRLIKDSWEINQMRQAVAVTAEGFEDMIRAFPRALSHWRGERVLEGAFGAKAREEGNGLGYETIVASGNHANTLHWTDNDGDVRDGDLVLIDAGAELDSLYTADITRTLPVSGHFSETQRQVYQAVLDACEAALAKASEPGVRFRDVHNAAMDVIAHRLDEWGILPVSAEASLDPNGGQYHRRWMPHGTSHHLGIDVHDCAQAREELYQDAVLQPGMVFTIEPGLYFRADDMKVPERFRGIGVRIEDDIVITNHGAERISEAIPRTVEDVEAWIARLHSENGAASHSDE
ncbi:MAG: aminopeptidase P family protein [Actinomycetaceae bacterium]|nr:aminopeptidase P family protein [Arcanobacterium sp.]MDD7686883.1 aminopeptidase P family protein [Actinomycetaceae bacterium]MDY5274026.1 aminopeptidase P family protein [Arcanobacterium sp.]